MDVKRKIITLCGSTKNREAFDEWNARLTMEGNIVISVGVFGNHQSFKRTPTPDEKELLDDIHHGKIDLCDEIFIIDKEYDVGDSTKREIDRATAQRKKVRYLSKEFPEWTVKDCEYIKLE